MITVAGEGVGGESLRSVVGECLVTHRTCCIVVVLVESDGVGDGNPLCVERDIAIDVGSCARGKVDAAAIGLGVPSREDVACTCHVVHITQNHERTGAVIGIMGRIGGYAPVRETVAVVSHRVPLVFTAIDTPLVGKTVRCAEEESYP